MIFEREIHGYIGGSDANKIYGSYSSKTFRDFWDERRTGIKMNEFSTVDTAVGNIMEGLILDEVGVPYQYRDIFKKKEGTIAGINTDALGEHYHEVKTALFEDVLKWQLGLKISVNYRRQLMHGLYVTGAKSALLHVLPMSREEKQNPFGLDISGRVFTFQFFRKDFDMEEHDRRIRYLTMCFSENIQPTDQQLNIFK